MDGVQCRLHAETSGFDDALQTPTLLSQTSLTFLAAHVLHLGPSRVPGLLSFRGFYWVRG